MTAGLRLLTETAVWALGWLLALVIAPIALLGWQPVALTSGSMEPHLRRGDVVLVDPAATVEHGQVISFPHDGRLLTHRVVEVTADGTLATKGDANLALDPGTTARGDVIGVGRLVVPVAGFPSVWSRGRLGTTSDAAFTDATTTASTLGSAGLSVPQVAATCTHESATILVGSRAWTAVALTWPPVPHATGYEVQRRRPWLGEAGYTTVATVDGTAWRDPITGHRPSAHGEMDTAILGTTRRDVHYRVVAQRGTWSSPPTSVTVGAGWTSLLGLGTFACGR